MRKREFKMQISIPYGGFEQPISEFTWILKMIPVEEITEAYVRAIISPEYKVDVEIICNCKEDFYLQKEN